MKRAEYFYYWVILLALCLTPPRVMALERQDAQFLTSSTHADHSAPANVAPWDSVSPEVAAREWNLTTSEWNHYRDLMQGRARYFAAEMPPLMVLAMYADSDKTRDHYAEMLAQYERDKADRILKVQRAYDAAMNRLYPDEKIIDLDLLRQQGLSSQSPLGAAIPGLSQNRSDIHSPRFGDKLALFASPDCDVCAQRIRTLATSFAIEPLEVYFAGDSTAFKQWIQATKLQPAWLKQHGVTFSRDEGQSKQYQASPGTVFIVRDHALIEMTM